MQKSIILNFIAALGVVLFNIFFWKETMGLNILLYTLFMIISLFWINQESIGSKPAVLTSIGTLLVAIMVVVNNSMLSKVIYILSTFTMLGFIQQRQLRFIWYGFVMAIMSVFEGPSNAVIHLGKNLPSLNPSIRILRLSVIPALIVPVFYGIYYLANPHFATISVDFWTSFWDHIIPNISIARFLFFLTSLLAVTAIIWKPVKNHLEKEQNSQTKDLIRSRKSKKGEVLQIIKTLGLKDEYKMAIILIGSLNLLLFFVNFLDIKYVWFGFDKASVDNFSQYVHEGTYLLIAAILLAMMVVLYYFRENLNFFPNNTLLKILTYSWIGQNAILAASVAIRNYHYIEYQGLAYKRIGVVIFLLLVFNGLWTLFQKVRDKRSTYFLLFRNSWALYGMLVLATCINWDAYITKYNLTTHTKGNIDLQFLLHEVSDKNIYLLHQYKDQLSINQQKSFNVFNPQQIEAALLKKSNIFLQNHKDYSWLSWNYPDYRNQQFLSQVYDRGI